MRSIERWLLEASYCYSLLAFYASMRGLDYYFFSGYKLKITPIMPIPKYTADSILKAIGKFYPISLGNILLTGSLATLSGFTI